MTEKKLQKRKPGPKLTKRDVVRLQLANKFLDRKEPPELGPYEALTHACVLYPAGLKQELEEALRKVPIGHEISVTGYLSTHLLEEWKRTCNRLRKALASNASELDLDYDTTWIFGAPDYDPASVEANMHEEDQDDCF